MNWDKMDKVSGEGRYCHSCNKVVKDFSNMSLEEINAFFLVPENTGTCGNFQKRHTNEANKFMLKLNSFETYFVKFGMKRLALILIGFIVLFSSCRRHIRGRKLMGAYSNKPNTTINKTPSNKRV